jgi:MYXO-CTERM domain-containing protein
MLEHRRNGGSLLAPTSGRGGRDTTGAMLRKLTPLLAGVAAVLIVAPASAAFHVWKVKEVYSNADGSVQYVELFTDTDFQTQLDTHVMTATSDGDEVVFTFEGNLSGSTAGRHVLIATPGFAELPGAVTPDYVLDCGPFFDPNASSITIDFAGFDDITFLGSELPTDGTASLTDSDLGAGQDLASGASSPTNFADDAGAMALAGCLQDGTCEPCDDGLFCNGPETCSQNACVPGLACPGVCDEDSDSDDGNPCTEDACVTGECSSTDSAEGTACPADGAFCNGDEACSGGQCVSPGDPCDGGETCDEGLDSCVDGGVGGGGGGTTSGGGQGGEGQGGEGQGGEGAQVTTVGVGGGGAGGEGAQVTTVGVGGGGGSSTGGGGDPTGGGGDPSGGNSTSTVGPGAGPGPSGSGSTTSAVATGAGGGGDGAGGETDEGCGCEAVGADRPVGAGFGLAALGALALGMRRRRRA